MKISKAVRARVKEMEPGRIFGLQDFIQIENLQAVSLELSRLSKKGEIQRLIKGKYFVPKSSRFGKLGPSEWEVLDQVAKANGGYFAGSTALSRIGVTTQVPAQVTVRGARSTRKLKIGNLTVNFVTTGNAEATYEEAKLTDIIETLRLIKKIPDGDIVQALKKIRRILSDLDPDSLSQLINLARNERPYVRALLGALLEQVGSLRSYELKSSLNPLTKYKLGINDIMFSNKATWGIS